MPGGRTARPSRWTASTRRAASTAEELRGNDYNLDLCGFPSEKEEILPPRELIEKYQADREAHERVMDEMLRKILSKIGGEE